MYLTCSVWRSLVLLFKHCTTPEPLKFKYREIIAQKAVLLSSANEDHKQKLKIVLDFFVVVFPNLCLCEEDNFSAHHTDGGRKLADMHFLGSLFLQLADSAEGYCE